MVSELKMKKGDMKDMPPPFPHLSKGDTDQIVNKIHELLTTAQGHTDKGNHKHAVIAFNEAKSHFALHRHRLESVHIDKLHEHFTQAFTTIKTNQELPKSVSSKSKLSAKDITSVFEPDEGSQKAEVIHKLLEKVQEHLGSGKHDHAAGVYSQARSHFVEHRNKLKRGDAEDIQAKLKVLYEQLNKPKPVRKQEISDGLLIDSYNFNAGEIPITVNIYKTDLEYVPIYQVSIQNISKHTEIILERIRNELINQVNIGMIEITETKKSNLIETRFKEAIKVLIKKYFPDLDETTLSFLSAYLVMRSLGMGKVEILMADERLEEITINSGTAEIWVFQKKHGWLKTNIKLDTEEQVRHYSAMIARKVGRQISVLEPLLDAHLSQGDRVNATIMPISSAGNTITIRKFSRDQFTITKFLQYGTISTSAAALIWMAMQYEMSALIAGGTASGKTSTLNVLAAFFPPNQRIISIEDSVLGDAKILYEDQGVLRQTTVGLLIDTAIQKFGYSLPDGTQVAPNNAIRIFSMTKDGKIELKKPSSLIRHKVKKEVIDISLASGRTISVTKDHSLFGLVNNNITALSCEQLRQGDLIATPRKIPFAGRKRVFDITSFLPSFHRHMVRGEPIRNVITENKKRLQKVISKSQLQYYWQNATLPAKLVHQLNYSFTKKEKKSLQLLPKRSGRHKRVAIPFIIEVDADLACLVGLWLADGSYDKNSIIISVVDEQSRSVVRRVAHRFGITPRMHSDGISLMLHSAVLKDFFVYCLELTGDSFTKDFPPWSYGLDRSCLAKLIQGYYSGDGWARKEEVVVASRSHSLISNLQTLLLRFDILLRFNAVRNKEGSYESRISSVKFIRRFFSEIGGFLQPYKNQTLHQVLQRSSKDISDIIPLERTSYLPLKHLIGQPLKKSMTYKSWKSWQGRYLQGSYIGRTMLQHILALTPLSTVALMQPSLMLQVRQLANNDLLWDEIVALKRRVYQGYVYDFSVPENESFVCNNIVAHNTREIRLPSFLHWVPMQTRLPNSEGKGEVSMADLLVNALRQRPDRILVGEVRRSREAETLFEAIHTGHSVYATFHANNVEETINRLLNPPINVPKTMLPAISLIIMQFRNRRTGLRRTFQIAEITDDAQANTLLQYDQKKDVLVKKNESKSFYENLSLYTGYTDQEIAQDLAEKEKVLRYLMDQNIVSIEGVGRVIAEYYINKDGMMNFVLNNKRFERAFTNE